MIVYEHTPHSLSDLAEHEAKGWKRTTKPTVTRTDYQTKQEFEAPTLRLEKFVGAVLCTRERNWTDDSDFYAVCWDEATGQLIEEEYDTTRFGGGGSASIDATDEVKIKAAAFLQQWLEAAAWEEYENAKNYVRKDKQVELDHGRPKYQDTTEKVLIGTRGVVRWYGQGRDFSRYGHGLVPMRALVVTEDGRQFWTDAHNLKVVDPDQYLPARTEVVEKCRQMAERVLQHNSGWHIPFAYGRGLFVV